MLWFLVFLFLIVIWGMWEFHYWTEWKKSLARNRLIYASEYDPQAALKILEECARNDPNAFLAVMSNRNLDKGMDPLQLKDECRGLVIHAPQTAREKIESGARAFVVTEKAMKQALLMALNIQDIASLPQHLHDQISRTSRILRSALHKNKCSANQEKQKATPNQQAGPTNPSKTSKTSKTQPVTLSDALAILPPPPTSDDVPLMLNNLSSPIHTLWLPSAVHMLECLYYRYLERVYRQHQFKLVSHHGVPIWVRNLHSASKAPPILFFHGISGIMPLVPELLKYLDDPQRTLICPAHPTLIANMRCTWGRGEMMTTLQFIRHVVSYLESQRIFHVDVLAWSFGGLQYNYFVVELKLRQLRIQAYVDSKISLFTTRRQIKEVMKQDANLQPMIMRRAVLIEPMGLPICNAVGGSYSLLSWWDALRRANLVAPNARWWHHVLAVSYFHQPRQEIPMFTEPIWSQHSFAELQMWDNPNILLFLSKSDLVTPMYLLNDYFQSKIPLTQIAIDEGEHGTWPTRKEFYERSADWLR